MASTDAFLVPLEDLLEAGSHFGHQAKRWNPRMKPYIYTSRGGVHIFDLGKTAEGLKVACEYVKDLVAKGGHIIFVGTKRQAQAIIKEEAQKVGAFYVSERWLGGAITNWDQVGKSVKKLTDMKQKREAGEYKKYTKKEQVLIDKDINRMSRFMGGLEGLHKVPDALFVVDVTREIAAVREANGRDVKVVAMVDTNANPDLVDYIIPVNDDAVRSIKLVVAKIAQAVAEGKALAQKTEKTPKPQTDKSTNEQKDKPVKKAQAKK